MGRWIRLLSLALLTLQLALPAALLACPACKDAIPVGDSEDEGMNNAQAYNDNIYLMLGVPYASLGIAGFLVYRGYQKNLQHLAAQSGRTEA